jgi:hypothetical protein
VYLRRRADPRVERRQRPALPRLDREVDEQGRHWIDITPTFRYRKPDGEIIVIDMHDADAWDRLAKVDIGKYSMLKVAYDMGFPFSHVHRARTKPEDLGLSVEELRARSKNPPECHEQPDVGRSGRLALP